MQDSTELLIYCRYNDQHLILFLFLFTWCMFFRIKGPYFSIAFAARGITRRFGLEKPHTWQHELWQGQTHIWDGINSVRFKSPLYIKIKMCLKKLIHNKLLSGNQDLRPKERGTITYLKYPTLGIVVHLCLLLLATRCHQAKGEFIAIVLPLRIPLSNHFPERMLWRRLLWLNYGISFAIRNLYTKPERRDAQLLLFSAYVEHEELWETTLQQLQERAEGIADSRAYSRQPTPRRVPSATQAPRLVAT